MGFSHLPISNINITDNQSLYDICKTHFSPFIKVATVDFINAVHVWCTWLLL